MKEFSASEIKSLKKHVVGMTQYFVHNFSSSGCPDYISTYDITSCVVVLLKNIDETRICSSFGMAHLNLANVFFMDKGEENLTAFINDFEMVGGCLKTASIQLLGGLVIDKNLVREKIIEILRKIGMKKGIDNLVIKAPESFRINTSLSGREKGNSEVMTVSVDKRGTYTRKVIFEKGKVIGKIFYPPDCQLLSDTNLKHIVPVEQTEYERLKTRTHFFLVEVNKLLQSMPYLEQQALLAYEKKIKDSYCTVEQVGYVQEQCSESSMSFSI